MALKVPAERYQPGNVPDTNDALIEFLHTELWRIATAINSLPSVVIVDQIGLIAPISPVPEETFLFVGEEPTGESPGGYWDSGAGAWEIPAGGLYQFSLSVNIAPFGGGQKDYVVTLRLYRNGIERWRSVTSGADDVPMGASLSIGGAAKRGDIITTSIVTEHDQFTGTITVDAIMSIVNTYQS